MRIEVKRDRSTVINLPEPGWVTAISQVSKAERDFWCAAGPWLAYEAWIPEEKDWRLRVVRPEKKNTIIV